MFCTADTCYLDVSKWYRRKAILGAGFAPDRTLLKIPYW